jgi:hypothetical protein
MLLQDRVRAFLYRVQAVRDASKGFKAIVKCSTVDPLIQSEAMGYITLSSIVATISVLPATLAVYSYNRHHRLLAYVFAHAAIAGFAVAVAASPPFAPHTTGVLGKVSSIASDYRLSGCPLFWAASDL